jgi:hypothetical protein
MITRNIANRELYSILPAITEIVDKQSKMYSVQNMAFTFKEIDRAVNLLYQMKRLIIFLRNTSHSPEEPPKLPPPV